MKIESFSNYLLVYLNDHNLLNINNINLLENDIKKLFKRLKNFYHIDFKGSYKIEVLKDNYYGFILKITEEDSYYDYYNDDRLSLKIKIKKIDLLYEVDDIYFSLDKVKIINDSGKIYFKLKRKLDNISYLKLIENSKIVIK